MPMLFSDRREAGRILARKLSHYAGRSDVLVLALPRGGVPVGFEVARALDAPLDIFLVRKLGFPGHEELAMGAIASGGIRVVNEDVVEMYRIPARQLESVAERERRELERRERAYRGDRPAPRLSGRTVILVDDGLATGSSMRAAATAVQSGRPARIVLAVPVAPPSAVHQFRDLVDEFVCVQTPEPFLAVGRFYENFEPTTDEEVRDLLRRAEAEQQAPVEA